MTRALKHGVWKREQARRSLCVLHVDHSGLPGGGQLGLARYATLGSRHTNHFHFLTSGPVVNGLRRQGVPTTVSALASASVRELLLKRRQLKQEIESFQPDLIVANSLRSAVALAIARPQPRMLYYVRQDMSPSSMGRLRRIIATALVFPAFGAFLANSAWTLGTMPRRLRGRPTAIAYPLSGVAKDQRAVRDLRESRRVRFLWLGRVAHWKGLHVVLEAIRLLEEKGLVVELTIAGAPIHEGADYDKAVRKTAAGLRSQPRFLGHVDDVPALLSQHDVLLHSSILPEPFGQVVVQGMAAGLAVVATCPGGPEEIIEPTRTGFLVPPGDVASLAQTIEAILAGKSDINGVGREAARVSHSRFSDETLGAAFDDAIQRLFDYVAAR